MNNSIERLYELVENEKGDYITFKGIPCTLQHVVTVLNRLSEEYEEIKKDKRESEKKPLLSGILNGDDILKSTEKFYMIIGSFSIGVLADSEEEALEKFVNLRIRFCDRVHVEDIIEY